jgi:PAS domain S-box-containing protein
VLESSTEYSVIAKDLEGNILLWNEGARRIYGYAPEEVVGRMNASALHIPEDVKSGKARDVLRVALEKGKYEGILKRRRKSGQVFTARVVMTVRRGPKGEPIGFLLVSKDITEEEKLTQQLMESQEYNRGLIESNIDALMTTDTVGIITDVNKQMERVTGLARDRLIGTPFKNYFTDPARAEEGIRRVLEEDKVTNYELTIRGAANEQTTVSYNATTFRGADGKLKGVFAAARDVTEQKKLEAQIREAQNYNRGLIEASLDALITVDPDNIITDVNRQMEKVTGYTRVELIGSRFADYFTEPDRAVAGVQKTLEEGFVTNYELVLRSASGQQAVVSFNASVFKDTEGRVKGIFASARDITEQKRLEEQMREAQNYNRGLIEASLDALVTVDPNLVITDVNEQMVRVTCYSRDELIGSPFKEYFTDPARAAAGVRQAFSKGFVTNYELVLRAKGGKEAVVSFNASVFKDTEGRVKGIFAAARDITEQKRLEERMGESQNYNRGLIEASLDALVTVDPNLTVTDVNEQMVRVTGYTRKQLIGTSFPQYFTDPARAAAGVRQTLEAGFVTNYELVLRTKDGKEAVVSFNASVFKDTDGDVKGIFAAARDITDQKRLAEQIKESQNYNRGLIESSVDALMTTDPLGIITDVNRQMEVLTGAPRQQIVGTPMKDYFTDPRRAEDGIRRVLAEDKVTNYELTIRSGAGRETIVSYNATTFKGTDGKLKGVFAAAREITEQKKLEAQIRESQNYNRSLIESSLDALVTVNPENVITDVNEQMVKLTGYGRNELVGSLFPDYFTDPERAASGVRQTFDKAAVTNYELVLRSRHGRDIHVSFNASVFKDTEGLVKGIFAAARDITEQKRLQEQIKESQHYNRSLIEASPDALVTVDPDIIVTDVNEQMVKLTGYTREELIGSSFKNYFTDPDNAAAGVRKTFTEGSVTNYEVVLKSKGGRNTLVSFNAAIFKDTEGKTAGIFASAREITEQKRTEEKLRESQNYNRGLIEASPDALVTVDPDYVITDVNEQMVKLAGYTRKQLVGSPFHDLFTDPDRAKAGVQKTLKENLVTNYELVLRKRSGQKIPVSFNAGTFFDTTGKVRGVFAAARDITEQKKLEERIRESQNYNRGLIESSIDALVTTDPLGVITDVNRQMEQLTGVPRETLVGTPIKNYFTDPQRAEDGVRRTLADDKLTNFELTLRARSGGTTDVSYNATTFRDTEGRLKGVFAAARDITEQRRLQVQLEQRNRELEVQNLRVQEANRLKSEFLANMSHELRTPLNGIIGFSDFIATGKAGALNHQQKEYLGDIQNSGRHLLQLINDVLDLAKVESGKMELLPEAFSPAKAVNEVCSVLKPMAEAKHLVIKTVVSPRLETMRLDPRRFRQVLYNLLSNAVKFTDEAGHVDIAVQPHGDKMIELRVRDTGIGIKKEDLKRLFTEFEQLDSGAARKYQGSGLGLALTKKLVELQGGAITVESEVGKGSTFTVLLPHSARPGD